ncbi:MAG: WecB/TagA/CpsF family glycosyltransferase [bacterium]|nr:WecB/TagA/CpsF family glycosyltransferase [bacterium]
MKRKTPKTIKMASKMARNIVPILGISLDSTEAAEVLNVVIGYVLEKKRCLIVTPNPEIVVRAQRDNTLRKIINQADFSLPDGKGLVWASGGRIKERIAGIDFAEDLLREAGRRGWKVFLLGGKEGVAAKAAQAQSVKLKAKNNNAKFKIIGESGPWLDEDGKPMDEREARVEKKTIDKIKRFSPDIVLVGFGPPKQEKWIKMHQGDFSPTLWMTVGGAFDLWSGKIKRAPLLVQDLGLEWAWRLLQEPRRARRIFTAVVEFPLRVLWHNLRH